MKIHHCIACGFNKFEYGPNVGKKINRFKCANPDTRRKNGSDRILNKRLIMKGHFPGWCGLEDADFNIPKVADKGYNHEKTI